MDNSDFEYESSECPVIDDNKVHCNLRGDRRVACSQGDCPIVYWIGKLVGHTIDMEAASEVEET